MVRLTAADQVFRYERRAKTRSRNVFELVLVVESTTGEVSIRATELDATSRDALGNDVIERAVEDWIRDHPNATVRQFVVRETNRCGYGTLVESEADADDAPTAADDDSGAREGEVLYRGGSTTRDPVGYESAPVGPGEEVEFHAAGPSTSVYGTETGTVTDVRPGPDDHHLLVVETESGTKRVRDDWLVDDGAEDPDADGDDTDGDAADAAAHEETSQTADDGTVRGETDDGAEATAADDDGS